MLADNARIGYPRRARRATSDTRITAQGDVLSMQAEFGCVLAPWNHAAEGGRPLERIAGEVGLDHLVVPVVSGRIRQYRFGCAPDSPYFESEGGAHYPVSAAAHAGVGLRLSRARWLGHADVLARLRDEAERAGLRVVLRVDLRGVEGLIEGGPHILQRNAWGQELPPAGACVMNPSLRELLRGVLNDLQRYEPAGFELVNWAPDRPGDPLAPRPLAWHRAAETLLDICHCPSCRQTAERCGIDPERVARSVRVQIERVMTAAPGSEADRVIAEYVVARRSDCSGWLQRLAAAAPQYRYRMLRLEGAPAPDAGPPWQRLTRVAPDPSGAAKWPPATELLREHAGEGLVLPAWKPAFATGADLVRFVSDAVSAGVTPIVFEQLEESPPEAVTWVKQAVRFARRG